MTERKDLEPATDVAGASAGGTGSEPKEPHGHDMADVIEGPVGSASIVDPERIPERDSTMPVADLEEAIEQARSTHA